MKKIELYRLKGLYREDFVVEGYRFGGEENSACIVGALRGNEMQQLYETIVSRKSDAQEGSYTAYLFEKGRAGSTRGDYTWTRHSGCANGKQLFHECWQTVLGSG